MSQHNSFRSCSRVPLQVGSPDLRSRHDRRYVVSQPVGGRTASNDSSLAAISVAVVLYLILSEWTAAAARTGSIAHQRPAEIWLNWSITLLSLALVAFYTQGESAARSSILGWIILAGASLGLVNMLGRILAEMLFSSGLNRRRCAIAGLNPLGAQLLHNARTHPGCGLDVLGIYDDRSQARRNVDESAVELFKGKLADLVAEAKAGRIDTVFVTLPMRAEGRIRWLLDELADTTANAYIVPDFFVFELLHSRWNSIGGLPAVSVFESPLYGVDGVVKRAFDVVVSTVALVVLLPLLSVLAVLVSRSSPGPVFFRQLRYGLDGKQIWVWKFRTMYVTDNGTVVQQATKDDPALRESALLARTSLDELPQLINVLEGSMSLVGPRPHATAHNEHYRKLIRGYMLR